MPEAVPLEVVLLAVRVVDLFFLQTLAVRRAVLPEVPLFVRRMVLFYCLANCRPDRVVVQPVHLMSCRAERKVVAQPVV